jgi:hypothetical protein
VVQLPFAPSLACALSLAAACEPSTTAAGVGGSTSATAEQAPATPAAQANPPKEAGRIAARREFPTAAGARATALLAGDLDGDGRDELLAGCYGPGGLQLFANLGRGLEPVVEPRVLAVDDFPLGPLWLAPRAPRSSADDARVVLASRAAPGVVVADARALLDSTGGALPVAWRADLPARPRALAVGGHDASGRPSIWVATIDDDLHAWREGVQFVRARLPDEQTTALLPEDGGSTVLVASQGSRRVVRLRVADGTLREEAATTLDGLPRRLAHGAWRGEERIFVAGGDHHVWILEPRELRVVERIDAGIVPIDLEFDPEGRAWSLALRGQEWRGHDDDAQAPVYAGQHPLDACLGDFDGDGVADAAFANGDAKRVSVLHGARARQASWTTARDHATGRSPYELLAADFDADGRLDVLALDALEGTLSLLRGGPDGLLEKRVVEHLGSVEAPRALHLDDDGKLDLLLAQRTDKGGRLVALFGDGRGGLAQRALVAPVQVGRSAKDVALVDLDGDGRPEAVVADPEGDALHVVRIVPGADGNPSLRLASTRATSGAPTALLHDAAARRLHVGRASGKSLACLELGAPGSLELPATESWRADLAAPCLALARGDLDGDGAAEILALALAGDGPGRLHALRAPDGSAWCEPLETSLRPYDVAAGDLDGDGRAEVLVSAQNSHHLNAWRATGSNTLARSADIGAGLGPLGMLVVDLDADGAPEILVANAFGDSLSVVSTR